MEKLILSKISLTDLKRLVTLQEIGIATYPWLQIESITVTENELRQIQDIKSRLLNSSTHLMNEATIWARGIYPLLALVEQTTIRACIIIHIFFFVRRSDRMSCFILSC